MKNPNVRPKQAMTSQFKGNTLFSLINNRLRFYQQNKDNYKSIQSILYFLDQPQASNINSIDQIGLTPTKIQKTGKVVSLVDFLNSNEP